ncbi:MAG: hypothetical protein IT232_02065 [Flavobacteriales bacterium]|nr:hypothetical protein [Flavobacteriales bacterium]
MKNLKYLFFFISFFFIATLNSCKEDCNDPTNPDCKNYDPCLGKEPANADFGIYEVIGEGYRFEHILDETDTILSRNGVVFKPKKDYDKVTWILGAETISTTELYRDRFPNGWINVTMIAEMNSHPCLKQEQLRDTLTKRFFVVPFKSDSTSLKNSPWWGTWEGSDTDNPNEKYIVTWGYNNGFNSPWLHFAGLPKGTPKQNQFYQNKVEVAWDVFSYPGYNMLWVINEYNNHRVFGCFAINAICIRSNNNLTIEYKFNNTPYQHFLKGEEQIMDPIEWINKKWVGHKISNQVITQ